MKTWSVHFQTIRPLANFPGPLAAGREVVTSPSYRFDGKTRGGLGHCLFQYTISGEGIFEDRAGQHRVAPGQGFLCWATDPQISYYYPPQAAVPWEFVWLAFVGAAARRMTADIVENFGPIHELSLDDPVTKSLLALERYDGLQPTFSAAKGASLPLELLVHLAELGHCETSSRGFSKLVERAISIINENLQKNLNVCELAEMLEVSREHFTRVFSSQMNMTPHNYILSRKLLLACELLKQTELTNKQIAARLGYDRPGHFSRTFKSIIHTTPGNFRKSGTMPVHWKLLK